MPFQPALDFRGLVRPVVIQHQVQFLVPGKVPVQAAQEPQEFLMAMPATALSDDFAVQYIERGEERGGSVPLVVVCHRAAPPFFQGQARLGAVQIQALDRTQPGLPLKKGRCGTMTHDYKRNGTATLFAALNVLDGKVIGQCSGRHRHQEFLRFLRRLDWDFPGDQELHLVLDNYGTHKTPEVERWLKRHPRFVRHFIPTSSSWVNLVERWFGELTEKAVRRGAFFSVPDLVRAIEEFLAAWNENPRPIDWTAKLEDILKKIERARAKLESIKPGSTEPRRRRKGEE